MKYYLLYLIRKLFMNPPPSASSSGIVNSNSS